MTSTIHTQLMLELRNRHAPLEQLLAGVRIHYLDVPFYTNVGDLLIMLGTLAFFDRAAVRVEHYGMYFNYDPTWADPSDTLVFQGGGNLGDIYGPFQQFRERTVAISPRNRIIILPQTIHFEDERKLEHCCQVFSAHPDLHLCVRDERSQALARRMTRNVYLMPDMAHQLWPLSHGAAAAERETLYLRRRDSESRGDLRNQDDVFDWDDLIGKTAQVFLAQVVERTITHVHRLKLNKPFSNSEARLWIRCARYWVDRAVELFSRYERIDSDRLHGHILACLIGLPNTIHDNSYGKNSSYVKQWTGPSDLVTLAPVAPQQSLYPAFTRRV